MGVVLPATAPLRALVLEDSADVLEGLVLALSTRNVEVVCSVPSATGAIDWLRAHPGECDVAIIDYFVLDGSGLDVLGFLQDQGSTIGRVVLTNYATDTIRRRCLEAGAAQVFDKTFDFEAMMEWFRQFQASVPR